MRLALGTEPQDVDVLLPFDADFVASIETVDGSSWPAGTAVALVFSTAPRQITPSGLRWEAAIVADAARWDVDKLLVQAVIAAGAAYARVLYTEADGSELLWTKGTVRVV